MRHLIAASIAVMFAVFCTSCEDKKTTASSGLTTGRPAMARAEFEKAVMGKTPKEVSAAVGEPAQKNPAGSKEEWIFAMITTNGSKTDPATKVYFEGGKVVKVEYVEPS